VVPIHQDIGHARNYSEGNVTIGLDSIRALESLDQAVHLAADASVLDVDGNVLYHVGAVLVFQRENLLEYLALGPEILPHWVPVERLGLGLSYVLSLGRCPQEVQDRQREGVLLLIVFRCILDSLQVLREDVERLVDGLLSEFGDEDRAAMIWLQKETGSAIDRVRSHELRADPVYR